MDEYTGILSRFTKKWKQEVRRARQEEGNQKMDYQLLKMRKLGQSIVTRA